MYSVLNFILSYHLLKLPTCCSLFMTNEKTFQKHLVVNMKSRYRNDWNNEKLDICHQAAASHICPYIVNLVTKKLCQVSDMLPGLKMELLIPIFLFALTLIFVTWILNVNLLKNMPPYHSVWGFWTGPLAKNGAYHSFDLIFTECSTCSDYLLNILQSYCSFVYFTFQLIH